MTEMTQEATTDTTATATAAQAPEAYKPSPAIKADETAQTLVAAFDEDEAVEGPAADAEAPDTEDSTLEGEAIPQGMIVPESERKTGKAVLDPRTMYFAHNTATFECGVLESGLIASHLEEGLGQVPVITLGTMPSAENPRAYLGVLKSDRAHPPQLRTDEDGRRVIASAGVVWKKKAQVGGGHRYVPMLVNKDAVKAKPMAIVRVTTLSGEGIDDLFRGRIEGVAGKHKRLAFGHTGRAWRGQQAAILGLGKGMSVRVIDSQGISYVIGVSPSWKIIQAEEPKPYLPFLSEQARRGVGLIREAIPRVGSGDAKVKGRLTAGLFLSANACLILDSGLPTHQVWRETLEAYKEAAQANLLPRHFTRYLTERCRRGDVLAEYDRIRGEGEGLDIGELLQEALKRVPRSGRKPRR